MPDEKVIDMRLLRTQLLLLGQVEPTETLKEYLPIDLMQAFKPKVFVGLICIFYLCFKHKHNIMNIITYHLH